jgi:hypothetical protein
MTDATQTRMTHTLLDVSKQRGPQQRAASARIAGDRIEAGHVHRTGVFLMPTNTQDNYGRSV